MKLDSKTINTGIFIILCVYIIYILFFLIYSGNLFNNK